MCFSCLFTPWWAGGKEKKKRDRGVFYGLFGSFLGLGRLYATFSQIARHAHYFPEHRINLAPPPRTVLGPVDRVAAFSCCTSYCPVGLSFTVVSIRGTIVSLPSSPPPSLHRVSEAVISPSPRPCVLVPSMHLEMSLFILDGDRVDVLL